METKSIVIENVPFIIPSFIQWPDIKLSDFGDYCGAGDGLGAKIVPDTLWGLKVSPACYIHDVSWEVAEPNWHDFHQTNAMFMYNLSSIIMNRSRHWLLKYLRLYRCVTYYTAVDSIGAKIFWNVKREQGKLNGYIR